MNGSSGIERTDYFLLCTGGAKDTNSAAPSHPDYNVMINLDLLDLLRSRRPGGSSGSFPSVGGAAVQRPGYN